LGDDSRSLRWASAGVVTASAVIVALGVFRTALSQPHVGLWAVSATCAYLPLHLWHVHHVLRGRRPAGTGWTVMAMAVIVFAALPLIGVQWFGALYPLSASVLLVLRPRWSVPVFGALIALPTAVSLVVGGENWGIYFSAGVLLHGLVLAVPVWLIATVRELRATSAAVAGQAIVRERVRVEQELRRTLGTALASIVHDGELAARQAVTAPEPAATRLRAMIRTARTALADGRALAARFQQAGLRAELSSAAAVLGTAGIDVRLVLPPDGPAERPAETLLAALRAEVVRLLQDDDVRECTISVVGSGVRVEIRSEGRAGARRVVAA
jgi:two-component system, NarL family, sensor histidine kinase DesK